MIVFRGNYVNRFVCGPDVTEAGKGIFEDVNFCIQEIIYEDGIKAINENLIPPLDAYSVRIYVPASVVSIEEKSISRCAENDDNILMYCPTDSYAMLYAKRNGIPYNADGEHTWDDGKVTQVATSSANGVRTFTCTICNATKTEIIPKIPKDNSNQTANETAKTYIFGATVSGLSAQTYTGKALTPTPIVKYRNQTLKAGTDYTVKYNNNVNAGTATVIIAGKGSYTGTKWAYFSIKIAPQPMTVTTKNPSVKASKLKKKKQSIKTAKAFTIKNAQGAVSYKKVGGNKKLTITSAGKITVKKGTKKGIYKIKVAVTAAGNKNYETGTKTVTVKVKVK